MFAFRRIPSLLRMSALDAGAVELSSWNRAARRPPDTPEHAGAVHASGTCTCGIAHSAGVYNEEAFHYLMAIEYKRFGRSKRPFVLVAMTGLSFHATLP